MRKRELVPEIPDVELQKKAAKLEESLDLQEGLLIMRKFADFFTEIGDSEQAFAMLSRMAATAQKLSKIEDGQEPMSENYLFLSEINTVLGQHEKNVLIFERFIKLYPESGQGYYELGKTYLGIDDPKKAIDILEQGLKVGEQNHGNTWAELVRSVQNMTLKIYEENFNFTAMYVQLGIAYFENGEWQKAIDTLELLPEPERNEPRFLALKAFSCQQLQRYDEAEDYCLAMLEHEPNNAHILGDLGQVYTAQERYPEAEECFQKAIELPSAGDNVFYQYYQLGVAYFKDEKFEKAAKIFESLPAENQIEVNFLVRLGYCYYELKEYAKAELCYKKVLDVDPDNVNALEDLGEVYTATKRYPEAEKCFQKAIELQPSDDSYLYEALGELYIKTHNINKAIEILEAGLRIEPDNEMMLSLLGSALIIEKKYAEAINVFEQLSKLDTQFVNCADDLNVAYYLAERNDKWKIPESEEEFAFFNECVDFYKEEQKLAEEFEKNK